ncbi:teichuronic acid biosynthesis glycosyltransferase TuaH [Flavobacterium sp. PL11]|jgi:teichuronic acid biosynthesis glycosyltransferase TuaH|uniref:glycosyltransferase n=1 Tax=Flavobacterium sp. PL11 TaxID=3071717 RepID=UPI002E051D0E|nr:teichuronic acid biosynthesis glycosyltransferase TuaH [Flavobacterium sp. PL11]
MIEGKDIVIIAVQAWDIEIGSNCKNIALEFAKKNRVLYVNPPLNRATIKNNRNSEKVQKRIKIKEGLEEDLYEIESNLWNLYPKSIHESINWLPNHSLFKILNKRNSRILSNDIKTAISRLDFKDFILFNDSSMFLGLHLKHYLKPKIDVYYMRDFLVNEAYFKKHGERLEPEIIKQADLVVTNSDFYADHARKYNANSVMVGQGCDVSLFSDENNTIQIPIEFKDIASPIIGYVGSLVSIRLDIELLAYMAIQRKDWNIVLVGPEDQEFKNSSLHDLSNIHFLGSKDGSELPSYIKGFDITMNPQLVNNLTIGNYPRKIDEYLAMGKPVIATKTKAMEMFQDHVYLASSKEEYITLIEKALEENTATLSQERKEFAQSHSWENNVLAIYRAIINTKMYQ